MNPIEKAVSPTKAAEILGISYSKIKKLIVENEDDLIIGGDENKRYVFVSQIRHLLMNLDGELPNPLQTETGEIAEIEIEDDEPEIKIKGVSEIYRVLQGGKLLDTWERPPTDSELLDAFGPGEYIIVRKNTRSNLTTGTTKISVGHEPAAVGGRMSPLEQQIRDLGQVSDFTRSLLGGGQGGGNSSNDVVLSFLQSQLTAMQNQNAFLLKLILDQRPGTKPENDLSGLLSYVETYKAIAELFPAAGGNTSSGLDRIIDVIADNAADALPLVISGLQERRAAQGHSPAAPTVKAAQQPIPIIQKLPATDTAKRNSEPGENTTTKLQPVS